ncbi:MAG TPA: carotenoid oxygenase family protein [Thermoanaerobaculia bacterium]|nr:carotenoid oxygenase family protein [Thermoanaerobaculia bacterium]
MILEGPSQDTQEAAVDFAPGLEKAFSFVPRERSCPVKVEGEIPAFLRGTYYLNGPARFERGGVRYRHWLDGDGMVCALTLFDEGARFACRFVRSGKYTAEEEAGQALFRTFGTAFPGDRLVRGIALESPVNVSVYPWAGKLLALGEQGLPWELDPVTLETRGLYNFGGALNPVTPFGAHPKIDPETGDLFNFGVSFASTQPILNIYRFDATGRLLWRRRHPLEHPCSIHDFLLGPRHIVFHLGPYVLDMASLTEGRTLMESLRWEPERGTRLLVIDRETGEAVTTLSVGCGYSLHTINAFEDGDRLIVDVVELERPVYDQYEPVPAMFTTVGPGGPVRYVVDLKKNEVVERKALTYRSAPDFPAIDPRHFGKPYEDLWMLGISHAGRAGRKFLDQVVHVSWDGREDVWQAPPGCYLGGEPAFAGDPSGPGGAVICQQLDTSKNESSFLIFDAFDVAAGPRAAVRLDSPVHLGFHAIWAE